MTLSIDSASPPVPVTSAPIALIPSSQVRHAERDVADGRLIRVRRGVLASAGAWWALRPWERYAARVHAVSITHPNVVFCLESAAVLLGLPIFGEPADVHVIDSPNTTSRLSGGIRVHTTAGDRVILSTAGVLTTSRMDTVIDLARSRHGAIALSVVDAALRRDTILTVEALVAHNESRISMRGRRTARWALHRGTALAETPLESISRAVAEWLGFDEPELQKEFRTEGFRDRCDMWWEGARVIGEADGDVKYDGSLQPSAEAIRREKDRDRRLRTHADAVAHWSWTDISLVAPLGNALRHAGLRPRYPEASRELLTLTQLLRPRRA